MSLVLAANLPGISKIQTAQWHVQETSHVVKLQHMGLVALFWCFCYYWVGYGQPVLDNEVVSIGECEGSFAFDADQRIH